MIVFKRQKAGQIGLIFFFTALLSFSASAQFKVYGIAKEGKESHHGEVISYEPNQFVTMYCQGDTLTFDLEVYEFKFTTRRPPKKYNFPEGVGYHRLSLGALAGSPDDGSFIGYTYHHLRSRMLGYGGGLSYENYGDEDGYVFIVPRVSVISYLKKQNTSPFLKADVGYGIALKNEVRGQTLAQGGINVGASLGYRLSTNRVMIDFEAGFRAQKGYYEFDFGDFMREDDIFFKRIVVAVGFLW